MKKEWERESQKRFKTILPDGSALFNGRFAREVRWQLYFVICLTYFRRSLWQAEVVQVVYSLQDYTTSDYAGSFWMYSSRIFILSDTSTWTNIPTYVHVCSIPFTYLRTDACRYALNFKGNGKQLIGDRDTSSLVFVYLPSKKIDSWNPRINNRVYVLPQF